MSRHLLIGTLLAVLGSGGVAWQVHAATEAALAGGDRATLMCPLAGHPSPPPAPREPRDASQEAR